MTTEEKSIRADWYTDAFDDLYPVTYAHRSVQAAEPEAKFAADCCNLRATDRVLDLCCGTGRHMAHLTALAREVIGIDYSPALLTIARQTIGSACRVVRADMRLLPFSDVFDVVMSFFTSFGYFVTQEENLAVLRGVARALRLEGRFFIDYVNAPNARQHFVRENVRYVGDYEIHERRWIENSRLNKNIKVFQQGQDVRESQESVQLYERGEFLELLRVGGLCAKRVYGDYGGAPLEDASPRMIVAGVRAKWDAHNPTEV